jgi:hypothetical protein
VQALDEGAHPLERPQLGAEAVCQRPLQQRGAQTLTLPRVQLPWAADGHASQRIDAAFIEPGLRGVCRLSSDTNRMCRLRRRLARQHQPPGANPLACRFVLPGHEPSLRSPT